MTPQRARRRAPRARRGGSREWLTGYLVVLPAVVVIGLFGPFPIGYAIHMSLFRWRLREGAFSGLDNYRGVLGDRGGAAASFGGLCLVLLAHWPWRDARRGAGHGVVPSLKAPGALLLIGAGVGVALGWRLMMATADAVFLEGLARTVYYGLGSVPVQIVLALVLASPLFQNVRGQEFFRMLYVLPYVTPAVAGAAVFRAIFSPRPESPANTLLACLQVPPRRRPFETKPVVELRFGGVLQRLGVASSSGFWAGPSLALVTLILFGIWTFTGYDAVIFLAGLGDIPRPMHEAAAIDGAGRGQQFRFITVPMPSPVT